MLPEDVNPLKEDGSPKSPEEIAAEVAAAGDATTPPGSKTESVLLLKSLQEERQKRKDLELELEVLKNAPASSDVFSEEGKALQKLIRDSDAKIEALTLDNQKKEVLITHPILTEKWEDFEKFRSDPENQGMSLKTAAKAFLVENGLLDQRRKGLEQPTGGERQPTSTKMSPEDIKILRETNFKEYTKLLEKGLIEV